MSSQKHAAPLAGAMPEFEALAGWASQFESIALDLGAGDGRFARESAIACPRTGVIAIDTCGANAGVQLRRAPANLRFIVADASTLPDEVPALADEITINFPWGSLLRALLTGDAPVLGQLAGRSFTVRVNAGAFAEAGFDFASGVALLRARLESIADRRLIVRHLERDDLRRLPTTWAKRLAFGRDPRAIELSAPRERARSVAD